MNTNVNDIPSLGLRQKAILDLLGKNASLFVAWNATTPRALSLVAAVILVPALAAYLLEAIIGLIAPRARSSAHFRYT